MTLDRILFLVRTTLQADVKTRMIILNRQGMAATWGRFYMTLEIHLPKIIGLLSLKALPGLMFERFRSINLTITLQHRRHRAGGRNYFLAQGVQPDRDLTTAPRWMTMA